jgi:hypothetical protein
MKQHTRTLSRLFLLLPLCVILAACGDDAIEPEADPTVSGIWSGTSGATTLTLTMNEAADGTVTGSGGLAGVALGIRSGTHVFPNLSLVLAPLGAQDADFTGTVTSATTIEGTLNGSGFINENFNLTKLPVL